MNKITKLFKEKNRDILSLFFTAGYPELKSTTEILDAIETSSADMIEIGIPFSDPVADGKVIQDSSSKALENGMSLEILFDQIHAARERLSKPRLLMGYFNPVMQFGLEKFCKRCRESGVDGVIIPDLPPNEYLAYRELFEKYGLLFIFLVTPGTSKERLKEISKHARGFIYAVSSYSTTGASGTTELNRDYVREVSGISGLPVLIGFGVKDNKTFKQACSVASGAIIGSAFIKSLGESKFDVGQTVSRFVDSIKG